MALASTVSFVLSTSVPFASYAVTVAFAATATWSPRKGAAYVVVEPGSRESGGGTLHGAVTYEGGGLASVPLTPLPLRLERPQVHPALR